MHSKNLYFLARGFLVQANDSLTVEQLDAFEQDCRKRHAQALANYRAIPPALRRTPAYKPWKLARTRGQHELSVLVPALRMVSIFRQAMARGRRPEVYRLSLMLLSKATRTAPQTLLRGPTGQTRFGYDKAYFTAQSTTMAHAAIATELLQTHPALFGELPEGLVSNKPLEQVQAEIEQAELHRRKTALLVKLLASTSLDEDEVALLRRFLG